jgi:hypothetical protein
MKYNLAWLGPWKLVPTTQILLKPTAVTGMVLMTVKVTELEAVHEEPIIEEV